MDYFVIISRDNGYIKLVSLERIFNEEVHVIC